MTQNHPAVLYRFWHMTGQLSSISGPHDYVKDGRRKQQWNLHTSRFEYVQAILAMIWFRLSMVKRAQAVGVMKEYLSTKHRNR